nr:hypothetical protein [uncultured Porphyromonas sp.]
MAQQRLRWLYMILLCIFSATACTQDLSEPITHPNSAPESERDYTILHPRDPRLTTKIFRTASELRGLNVEEEDGFNPKISPYKYLGYSYKVGNGIIGHPENLGRSIIDVEGMLNDPSFRDYIIFNRMRYAHSEVQAYDSYDNLAKDATTTKKVEGGFALNLKLFTIGAKTTYNNTFHSFQSTDEKTAAGRLDLFYYDSKIQIDNLSYVQKKIGYSYFRRSFTESLYNSPMTELLEKQGPLVVFGYYTGGRATALYHFNQLDGVDQTNTNRSINSLIGATFNWASDGSKRDSSKTWSGGASIGYDGGNGTEFKRSHGFSSVYNQISLFGGSPENVYSSPAKDVANNFVNLSSWLNSLADPKHHAFVDATDNGLVRLDHLLLEKNFREKLAFLQGKHYLKNKWLAQSSLKEEETIPRIEILHANWMLLPNGAPSFNQNMFFYVVTVPMVGLYTRFGDIILFANEEEFNNLMKKRSSSFLGQGTKISPEDLSREDKEIIKKLDAMVSPIFDCEIREVKHYAYPTSAYRTCLPFDFTSKEIYRYKNPKTNIWYIYDKSTKSAFSFYDDDYIPEVYGIDRWFKSLPERAISMRLLAERYTIIGL